MLRSAAVGDAGLGEPRGIDSPAAQAGEAVAASNLRGAVQDTQVRLTTKMRDSRVDY